MRKVDAGRRQTILRIGLLLFILGGAGHLNDGGILQGALCHHDIRFCQPVIDGLEQLAGQLPSWLAVHFLTSCKR